MLVHRLADLWPTNGQLTVKCWRSVGGVSAISRPTRGWHVLVGRKVYFYHFFSCSRGSFAVLLSSSFFILSFFLTSSFFIYSQMLCSLSETRNHRSGILLWDVQVYESGQDTFTLLVCMAQVEWYHKSYKINVVTSPLLLYILWPSLAWFSSTLV